MSDPPPLVEHLELYFGTIETGWKPEEWTDSSIQIVEFRNGKIPGVTVLSTLGLSSFPLQSSVSEKLIRQELFVMLKKDEQPQPRLAAILDQVARERVGSNLPVLRGDVVVKEGLLLTKGDFVGFYATLPIYYPESFWTFNDEHNGAVIFGWLIPIKKEEWLYIRQNGWSAFEESLDTAKFDLFDLDRASIL